MNLIINEFESTHYEVLLPNILKVKEENLIIIDLQQIKSK